MPVLTDDSQVKVARSLRRIEQLQATLLTQAIGSANDRLMPGGLAMVALANVANQEKFANLIDTAERRAIALAEEYDIEVDKLMPQVEDDDWEPPLQTLCFWSEQWRAERGQEFDTNLDGPTRSVSAPTRPSITTEAGFLARSLDWAWINEVKWTDFVEDMRKVVDRLEGVLLEGTRPVMRGVPCLYDECRGARLIRTTIAKSDKNGRRVWVLTDWHCPRCERSWDEEAYERFVYAAIHRQKSVVAEFDNVTEIWCTVDLAAKKVDRPESTVRVWLHREQIHELCGIGNHRRWRYVLLTDVVERDRLARERWERRLAAMKTKRGEVVQSDAELDEIA